MYPVYCLNKKNDPNNKAVAPQPKPPPSQVYYTIGHRKKIYHFGKQTLVKTFLLLRQHLIGNAVFLGDILGKTHSLRRRDLDFEGTLRAFVLHDK